MRSAAKPFLLTGPDHKALERRASVLSAMADYLAARPPALASEREAVCALMGHFNNIDVVILAGEAQRMAFEQVVVAKVMGDR